MTSDEYFLGAIERMDDLTAPSIGVVRTVFAALDRAVATVGAECRSISETLRSLDDALHIVTQGGGGQDLAGFGLVSLPILGAIRAVKSVAGQYVKQQTGVTLNTWTDFVATSSEQFETYVSQLDTAAQISVRYRTAGDSEIDLQSARDDLDALTAVRWQTQGWKQTLSRVTQLGQVVDAILQVDIDGELEAAEPRDPESQIRLPGALQRRFKEVQSRTLAKSGDLREWVLRPFVDVRDRVRQLPGQIEHLAREVAMLEVLLDLELAEVRACVGHISPEQSRIVGVRVATSVLLPELARQINETKNRSSTYRSRLDRLGLARDNGEIDQQVYSILADEYQTGLDSSKSRLAELEAHSDLWRRDGPAILDACGAWMTLELAVLGARRLAEQVDVDTGQQALLQRELERLNEAKSLMASL